MHLQEWGFTTREPLLAWTAATGQQITNVYLEQAYKGNILLYATIDGTPRRWIFRPSFPEYATISRIGITNLPVDILKQLVEKRL